MWFGEKHKEALATLEYGILDNKGFLLLTGDVGTGKTTLINALLQRLSDDVICTSVPDPGLDKMDFFNYIAAAFGIKEACSSKGSFLVHFRNFLIQANADKKKVLLIIDEAQRLTQEMLEEIRLLSNIEKMDAKLINIFFVGQNEFNEILNREQNRAVRQRLTLNYNIDPLTLDETADYIKHRLSIAGAAQMIFDEPATREVFVYSGGFPRRINVICDHSLLSGYVGEQKMITRDIVSECARELKIPAYVRNRRINGAATYHENTVPVEAAPNPPSVEAARQEGRNKGSRLKKKTHAWEILVFSIIIAALGFFLFFPRQFNASVQKIGDRTGSLKSYLIKILPESYFPLLSDEMEPDKKERETGDAVPGPSVSSPNKAFPEENQTMAAPDKPIVQPGTRKVAPFQGRQDAKGGETPLLAQENASPVTQTEKRRRTSEGMDEQNRNKGRLTEKNVAGSTAAPAQVEKNILPLPEKKVIVRFKYNTNDFTDEGFARLVAFSEILAMHPEENILVTGYTDAEGYQKYNRKLSEFRANIVRSFLLGRGIKPEQVEIRGMGSENPVESNETAWGRMMNRRVEIELKNKNRL